MEKMINSDVAVNFVNRLDATSHTQNFTSEDGKLYSYNTIIAEWHNGKLLVNTNGYSSTTRGKHQSQLKRHLKDIQAVYYIIDAVPENSQSLVNYAWHNEDDENLPKYWKK